MFELTSNQYKINKQTDSFAQGFINHINWCFHGKTIYYCDFLKLDVLTSYEKYKAHSRSLINLYILHHFRVSLFVLVQLPLSQFLIKLERS